MHSLVSTLPHFKFSTRSSDPMGVFSGPHIQKLRFSMKSSNSEDLGKGVLLGPLEVPIPGGGVSRLKPGVKYRFLARNYFC